MLGSLVRGKRNCHSLSCVVDNIYKYVKRTKIYIWPRAIATIRFIAGCRCHPEETMLT